jgi:pilus assembly protein CpaB
MNKKALFISIAMIIFGALGLFLYTGQEPESAPQQSIQPDILHESIAVAVATRDLAAGGILTADDFSIKNIAIVKGGSDKQFSMSGVSPVNYLLKNAVSAGSYIPLSALAVPGSDEYLAASIKPGNVVYPLPLDEKDSYLMRNVVPGQYVDIYLEYGFASESNRVVSPSVSFNNSRLKPLLANKRILAIRAVESANERNKNKINELVLDLKRSDVKIINTLRVNNARILVFPGNGNQSVSNVTEDNSTWPVNDDALFTMPTPALVNELRG